MGNIPDSKGEQLFRILSGNVNGLCLDSPLHPKLHEILTNPTIMQADTIIFEETNTDFKKIVAMNIFQQKLKFYYQNHATTLSNSIVHAKNKNWLQGGTITSVLGRWTRAKITSGNDYPLGHWSWISLKGKGNKIITLVNVYRVNPGHTNLGEYTNFKQQVFIKLNEGIDKYNPRTQTIIDLQEFVQNKMNLNKDIIICIDANKTPQNQNTDNIPSISTLINNLGLINLISTIPGQYESRKNGRLIDLCLISLSLLSSIHAFRYLPYDKITNTSRPR